MPVIVTSTATARCWKQHTCSACGCIFRYVFTRSASASGSPDHDTRSVAQHKLAKALHFDIEEYPCPTCGYIQPDMVSKGKKNWHLTFTILSGVFLLLIVLAAHKGSLALDEAGKVAAVVAAFGVLGHVLTALGNPNARPARNLKQVQKETLAGKVEVVQPGTAPNFDGVPPNLSGLQALCLLALLATPLAFLAVVWVSERHPTPRNPTLKPIVVGPGDTVSVPLKTSLSSVGGYWRGNPTVKVLNATETGAPNRLAAYSDSDGWGKVLHVKDGKSPLEPIQPWVKVVVPQDPNLGGKSLRLQVALTVSYPVEARKGGNHAEQSSTVQQEVEVHLAEPGAELLHKEAWSSGVGVGLGGCFLGGLGLLILCRLLKAQAKPNQVFA